MLHSIRVGSAAASLLPSPPVNISSADPVQTVPRGSPSCKRPDAARSIDAVNQRAGANKASAKAKPSAAPKTAQVHEPRGGVNGAGPATVRARAGSARRQGQHQRALPQTGGVAMEVSFVGQGTRIDAGLGQPLRQRIR
jgi:hypothetical protein